MGPAGGLHLRRRAVKARRLSAPETRGVLVEEQPGHAEATFQRLLDACEAFAAARGARTLELGVNTACHAAYRAVLARGYRGGLIGVAMERPDGSAYYRADAFVLGDWR